MKTVFRFCLSAALALGLACGAALPAAAKSRIKDIVDFENVRENLLTGSGLVVGLSGTGDTLDNSPMTRQALQAMLERLGTNTRDAKLNTKNVAMVMVTAKLPPFAAQGSPIDVTVSALGDAKSLLGGSLVVTSLYGADGEVYAVAQGTVQTGAVSATGGSGTSVTRGVPTAGRIASGAVIERESAFQLASMSQMRLTLKNPDFTTSRRIADVVNQRFPGVAVAENPTIVSVRPPGGQDMASFMTTIEQLEVEPDNAARVVIDEVSGVIVMGADVRISQVAIAQGNLTISVQETPQVSQPAPFSQGRTTVTSQSNVKVEEEKGKQLLMVGGAPSLATLVSGLNALGVTPRDMISILQTIKAAGALQADIQVL
ncbi:MAG: flagellar basal body P-ring protein FlgI [Caulobacteraceae bacterium]